MCSCSLRICLQFWLSSVPTKEVVVLLLTTVHRWLNEMHEYIPPESSSPIIRDWADSTGLLCPKIRDLLNTGRGFDTYSKEKATI